ncbi:MAG TPA: hypothetical protein VF883_24115 [Thermoanaerobaculia bacterium]|jgi:hypothetical protein
MLAAVCVGVLVLITMIYFVLLPGGAESYSRFRVPVVPMYAIAGAAGAEALIRLIRRPFPRSAGVSATSDS